MAKKIYLRICALCLALVMCLSMAACSKNKSDNDQSADGNTTYTVQVCSEGGKALEKVAVYVYKDETLADLVAVEKTDAEGNASFQAPTLDTYAVVLQDVPSGYLVELSYPITGETTQIRLAVELVEGDLSAVTYWLGDVMQDFTFTATDGNEYKLSELLQTKKAVVLNFWYINCNPCRAEFPYLQEAYAQYSDDIELLAMNPQDKDNTAIAEFATDLGLTFPVGAADPEWATAMQILGYPTTVVIDRYGSIALIHESGFKDAQIVGDIFEYFTADDYEQTTVKDIEQLRKTEAEVPEYTNPTELGGVTEFELTLEPSKEHSLDLYKVTDAWMQIQNADIYVEYGGQTYTASNGVVSLFVTAPDTYTPAQLTFGNSGDELQTFQVTLSGASGSYSNPYTLKMGDFSASVAAGNDQGVYFTYTAQEDGYLNLKCTGVSPSSVKYDFSIHNLQSYVYQSLGLDAVESGRGNEVVSMPMNKGETVRVTIAAVPDEAFNYPSATFYMFAEFKAGEVEDLVVVEKTTYAVTVTDENRNPVKGVNISLSNGNGNNTSLITDENGVASAQLEKGTYTGRLVVSSGYKAHTTKITLTEAEPYVSLKLDSVASNNADYVVRVIDNNGNPVEGTLVTIGNIFGYTDSKGTYTVTLEKGTYTAMISLPSGYSSDKIAYPFPANSTLLGITVNKGGSSNTGGVNYTIKVVDTAGYPVTNVVATFLQNGTPVAISSANASGVVTANLPSGSYTVSLTSSSGQTLTFDSKTATLSASKTTVTIAVTATISENSYDSAWWGNHYCLYTGSTKVSLEDEGINYSDTYGYCMFVFYPAQSGIYQVSVGSGVQAGYFGSVNFPNGPISTTDDGPFTLRIMESEFANGSQPAYVLGIKANGSATDGVITIARTGEAPVELPVTTYKGTTTPTKFTLNDSGTMTFVNLEGTANVERKSDGYYYLNGEKLYIKLGSGAPYVSIYDMLGVGSSTGTGTKGFVYDGAQAVGIEDYTECLTNYCSMIDSKTGVYPLNDDLVYMIKGLTDYMGWGNSKSPNYRFGDLTNLNPDLAWMFAVCYFK